MSLSIKVGPTNIINLLDHHLWSILQSVVTRNELLYTFKITVHWASLETPVYMQGPAGLETDNLCM